MVEGNGLNAWVTAIGTSNVDWSLGNGVSIASGLTNNTMLQKFWACQFADSNHLTLNRPWDGANGSAYHLYSYVVAGFEVQPFMLGIKTTAMNWAAQVDDATVSSGYAAILPQVGEWMNSYGLDTNTGGVYYARVMGLCEPFVTSNPDKLFVSIHGYLSDTPCGFSGLAATLGGGVGELTERVNSVEAGTAMLQYFLASRTSDRRAAVDRFYGSIFGNCALTQDGGTTYYCDSNYVNTAGELSNGSLAAYKWTGFFFGVGGLFTNSWPAIRTINAGRPDRRR